MNQGWYDTNNYGGNNYYDNVRQGSMNNVPRQPQKQIICYGCGKPGHLRRTCRNTMAEEPFDQYQGQEDQSQNHFANQSSSQMSASDAKHPQEYQAMYGPVNMGGGNGVSMREPRSTPGLNGDHDNFEARKRGQTRENRENDRQVDGNQEPRAAATKP